MNELSFPWYHTDHCIAFQMLWTSLLPKIDIPTRLKTNLNSLTTEISISISPPFTMGTNSSFLIYDTLSEGRKFSAVTNAMFAARKL
jgi:hypothetical protein